MKSASYWSSLEQKNPLLKTEEKLTVSVAKLREIVEQAFEVGFEHGKGTTSALFDRLFPSPPES